MAGITGSISIFVLIFIKKVKELSKYDNNFTKFLYEIMCWYNFEKIFWSSIMKMFF